MVAYYILFDSHEQAIKLHGILKKAGYKAAIAPTPRAVSICCGVSLMLKDQDINIEQLQQFLTEQACVYKSIETVDLELNAHRDRYI